MMSNTVHWRPGRFLARILDSLSCQQKVFLILGLLLWVAVFYIELLPAVLSPDGNGTGFQNQAIDVISALPHDSEPVHSSSLSAIRKNHTKLEPAPTQSDFLPSSEFEELKELTKGSENTSPNLPDKDKDQTISPEEKAKIVEEMKKHVSFINTTRVSTNDTVSQKRVPPGQGSALRVLRRITPPPQNSGGIRYNDGHETVFPGQGSARRVLRRLTPPVQNFGVDNKIGSARRVLGMSTVIPKDLSFKEEDETVALSTTEQTHESPVEVEMETNGTLKEDQTPPQADDEENETGLGEVVNMTWNEDYDEDVSSKKQESKTTTTENPPNLYDLTNLMSFYPGAQLPFKSHIPIVAVEDYEESRDIAIGERLRSDDYFEQGMNARWVQRYPRWKKPLEVQLV